MQLPPNVSIGLRVSVKGYELGTRPESLLNCLKMIMCPKQSMLADFESLTSRDRAVTTK